MKRVGIIFLLLLVLTGLVYIWGRFGGKQQDQPITLELVREQERAVINTKTKTVTVTRPGNSSDKGKNRETVVRGVRQVTVGIGQDGRAQIVPVTKGASYGPGLVAAYSNRLRLGIDVELFWWKRINFTVGGVTDDKWDIRVYGAVGYNVYSNTWVFAGMDHEKKFLVGVRVEL